MSSDLNYHCISRIEELRAIRAQWNDLENRQADRLLPLSHAWHMAWWESFGAHSQLALGVVSNGTELVAIAPLYTATERVGGFLLETTMLAVNGYSPFGGLLLAPDLNGETLDQILELLVTNNPCDLIRLQKLPTDSALAQKVLRGSRLSVFVGIEESLRTPVISLQGDWLSYLKTLSSSSRKTVRRKLRRFEKEDELRVQRFDISCSRDPVLEDIVAVSAHSWKAESGSDLESDTVGQDFLWRLIDELGPQKGVSAWVLFSGDKPIAFELLLHYDGIVYPIRADYDQSYTCVSPGSMLMAQVLRHLFDAGQDHTYDCCGDNYEYLRSWSKETRTHVDVDLFSRALLPSLAYSLKYSVAPFMRNLRQKSQKIAGSSVSEGKRALN